MRWTLPPDSSTIDFGAQDNLGTTESVNGFTAVLNTNGTGGEAPAISSITFTLIPSLNDTSITCGDTGLGGTSSCQLFVIGECQSILSSVNFETSLITGPPEIPIALQNTSSTFESVELQWSPPSFNGGSTITQYHINVSPPSNTGDSSCPGGQCNTPDTRFNVTGLDFNQQYNSLLEQRILQELEKVLVHRSLWLHLVFCFNRNECLFLDPPSVAGINVCVRRRLDMTVNKLTIKWTVRHCVSVV